MTYEEYSSAIKAIDDELAAVRNRSISKKQELRAAANESGLNHTGCMYGCTVEGDAGEPFNSLCFKNMLVEHSCPCEYYKPDNKLSAFIREHTINSDTLYFMLNQFNACHPDDLTTTEQDHLIKILTLIHDKTEIKEETKHETEVR